MTVQAVAIKKSQGLIRLISNTNNITFTAIDTYLPKDFKSLYEEDERAIYYPHGTNHPDLYIISKL